MPLYLKHWLTAEEYAELDENERDHYVAHGDEYKLRPDPREERQFKISLIVLGVLVLGFGLIGLYGRAIDDWSLEILGFCGSMPTLFSFFIQLAVFFSSS